MNKNYMKLSTQLSLGIMLMVAPIFILSLGILFMKTRSLIHQEVMETSVSMLNTTQHRIRTYMGTIETAANSNAWMLEENFRPDSLRSVSNRIVRLNPPVRSSSIFTVPNMFKEYGRGFSLFTVHQDDTVATYCEPEYDYFERACYIRPVNSGNACWVDPFVDNIEGDVDYNEAIATYCRPLKQEDGRILGVVTADLSFSRMANMLNSTERPFPHAYYMLLGGDGRYLIHPDTTRLFRKTIFTDANPGKDMNLITLGHEMTAGKQGTMHIESNGELYHVSYLPVPSTDWSLALVCPDDDAMKNYYYLGYLIIALLVVGLLAIMVLCYRVVRRTVSPINRLTGITQKISDGQYDEPIPVSRRKGIIGQLQNSFVTMQQSLNERMGTLQQYADEIRQHNEETDRANKQAEDTVRRKDRFIEHVTQQMRMPLNVIMGFADVLGESTVDPVIIDEEEVGSITSMMKSNIINMNRMLLMLFDATDTDATETLSCQRTDEVSCNEISQGCINFIRSIFPGTDIQFETDVQDALCILTSRIYLKGILRELLYNAVTFSDEKHILLRVTQTESTVCFTVQDVGPGLPKDLPSLEYKSFTRKDDLPEDVGLGLSWVKQHCICLGGSMTVDTSYHEGCRIVIEMPK